MISTIESLYATALASNNAGVHFLISGNYVEAKRCFRSGIVNMKTINVEELKLSKESAASSSSPDGGLQERERRVANHAVESPVALFEMAHSCEVLAATDAPRRYAATDSTTSSSPLDLHISKRAVLLRAQDMPTTSYYASILTYNYALSYHLRSMALSVEACTGTVTAKRKHDIES